jgi:hypothetical protein
MNGEMDYTGRHRNGDDGSPYFPGQPGDPPGDPQVDTTIRALRGALKHLTSAAGAAECILPEAGQFVSGHLGDAALIAFGFEPGSDEAKGLHLLIAAIRQAKEATA